MATVLKRKILLVGPALEAAGAAYGGGMGGYVRNMQVYLRDFDSPAYELVPCFNSVRRRGRFPFLAFVPRFVRDLWNFARLVHRCNAVHILAQYRSAFPRELCMGVICRMLQKPLVYEVKAGRFVPWFEGLGAVQRVLCSAFIRTCCAVLCEGESVRQFVEASFGRPAEYFPNFVPEREVPEVVPEVLPSDEIRIAFVGFCYRGKGVFELLDAVVEANRSGLRASLVLAGEEEPEFATYADSVQAANPGISIRRLGRVAHERALEAIATADVFCLASSHIGEGHSNVLNEAMMLGRVIVTTAHGFSTAIVDDSIGYVVPPKSAAAIVSALDTIAADRDVARDKARAARVRLLDRYTSRRAFRVLEACYDRCLTER